MRKKLVMFTTILTLAICISCLGFGVWAAIRQGMTVNHTIGFIADSNVYVEIDGQIFNAKQTNLTQAPDGYNSLDEYWAEKGFTYSSGEFNEEDREAGAQVLENWIIGGSGEYLEFDESISGQGITFQITVRNFSDVAIYVEITNYVTNNENLINTPSQKIRLEGYTGGEPDSGVVTLNTKPNSTNRFEADNNFTVSLTAITE